MSIADRHISGQGLSERVCARASRQSVVGGSLGFQARFSAGGAGFADSAALGGDPSLSFDPTLVSAAPWAAHMARLAQAR